MVSGRAGEAKTSFSNFCVEHLESLSTKATIVSFAYGVKSTANAMGWDREKDDKGRRLLQQIGNVGREYNEDIWANMAVGSIIESQVDVVFIDDWRFPNEGNVILQKFANVIKVRVCRPEEHHTLNGTELYDDISETSLPEIDTGFYNHVVDNIGSLEELGAMADEFVKSKIVSRLTTTGGNNNVRNIT